MTSPAATIAEYERRGVLVVETGRRHDPALAGPPVSSVAKPVTATVFVKTPNPTNGRVHWRVMSQRAKEQHAAVWCRLFDVPMETRQSLAMGCTVTMTRISVGTVDSDNLHGCLKAVRDTVACWLLDGAIGAMDSDPRITWQYGQEKGKRGVHAVRIEIEPRAT